MPSGPPKANQFKSGNPGGPGRPKGTRNKLSEAFVKAMSDDFAVHGLATIELARAGDPLGYVKVVASLCPKELTGEDGAPLFEGLTVQFVKAPSK